MTIIERKRKNAAHDEKMKDPNDAFPLMRMQRELEKRPNHIQMNRAEM